MDMIWWEDERVYVLDQTELPTREITLAIDTPEQMADAIRRLVVRGAPLIGVAAAFGLALSTKNRMGQRDYMEGVRADAELLRSTRPTAVNLSWAIDRVMKAIELNHRVGGESAASARALVLAQSMREEDIAVNRKLGALGQTLIDDGDGVLTHCNAGALATAGYGTALGVIRAAVAAGKRVHVYADETRPLLQGARLTAWELVKDGIDVTLLTDSMAASLMREGRVQKVIVGADRIAQNGDTANKIGTYQLALIAEAHGIPFYVAAPESTIDRAMLTGAQIPIETRDGAEVRAFAGVVTAPAGAGIYNPAFDVTPARLIHAIVTEEKIYHRDKNANFAL